MLILKWLKKEKKIIIASLITGFVFSLLAAGTYAYSEAVQGGISDSVIRFHVLANSDSQADQALKVKVKDSVLESLKEDLKAAKNIEDSRKILESNFDKIREISENVIMSEGYDYTVTVSISSDLFPQKEYGDVVFPAGFYNALRIVIGDGSGSNWWCVMYPPLCFVDVTHTEIPQDVKLELKNVLTEDEYTIVVNSKSDDVIDAKIKFKIVEWWQERKNDNKAAFNYKGEKYLSIKYN